MDNTFRKKSDGYKPTTVPQSFKLILGGSDHIQNEDNETEVHFMSTPEKSVKTKAVGMHIINFAVSNLQKSFEFYFDRLGISEDRFEGGTHNKKHQNMAAPTRECGR